MNAVKTLGRQMEDLDSRNTVATAIMLSLPKTVSNSIKTHSPCGSMAEHVIRNDEVGGSNPPTG